MAQQVLHAKVSFVSTHPNIDNPSFTLTFEATGSATTIDFTVPTTPTSEIIDFLTVDHPGMGGAIQSYLSQDISGATNNATITYTDVTAHLDGSSAGSPIRTDTFTVTPHAGTPTLPGGASVCIAYRADYGTAIEHGPIETLPTPDDAQDYGAPPTHMGRGRPRGNLRGRLYYGPLNTLLLDPHGGMISSSILADFAITTNILFQTKNPSAADQFNCVVWSRRQASVASAHYFYVNEAFAYQRRRADVSTARTHDWVHVV